MTEEYLPIDKCKRRYIYRLDSRNLAFGVFTPEKDNGFIGIRQKFDSRFLFTEYHWDNGPPHGTAKPLEEIGPVREVRIRLVENLPSLCRFCGERVEFKKATTTWSHIASDGKCVGVFPIRPTNKPLFALLEEIEKEHGVPPVRWKDRQ